MKLWDLIYSVVVGSGYELFDGIIKKLLQIYSWSELMTITYGMFPLESLKCLKCHAPVLSLHKIGKLLTWIGSGHGH
jgi:hypothetical protein